MIPYGSSVELSGREVPLIGADVSIGVLYVFAMTSLSVYGIILAGWASNNKFSLLGGIRSGAQIISYELAMTTAAAGVILAAGSFRLTDIVEAQTGTWLGFIPRWNAIPQLSRIRHLPRADLRRDQPDPLRPPRSGGGARRRLSHRVLGDELRHVLHGRIHQHDRRRRVDGDPLLRRLVAPWLPPGGAPRRNRLRGDLSRRRPAFFVWLFIWVRWTLPRFRYDQLMRLGWKVLLPLALVNLFWVAGLVTSGSALRWRGSSSTSPPAVAILFGAVMVVHRNPVKSVLSLVVSFFALAVCLRSLAAPFIAAIQVIVYAGAILVLFLFVLMLLNVGEETRTTSPRPVHVALSTVGILIFAGLLLGVLRAHGVPEGPGGDPDVLGDVPALARLLFSDFLLPFEALSVLLLAALVGAFVLARRETLRVIGSIPLGDVLLASAALFLTGLAGALLRRNAITIFLSIELMMNAANLALIGYGAALGSREGMIVVFFVIAIAAAEASVGLAIFVALFRHTESIDVNKINLLKW